MNTVLFSKSTAPGTAQIQLCSNNGSKPPNQSAATKVMAFEKVEEESESKCRTKLQPIILQNMPDFAYG